jgi:hypothetical protein
VPLAVPADTIRLIRGSALRLAPLLLSDFRCLTSGIGGVLLLLLELLRASRRFGICLLLVARVLRGDVAAHIDLL